MFPEEGKDVTILTDVRRSRVTANGGKQLGRVLNYAMKNHR